MRATIDRTLEVLTRDGLVYRYLDADDGLPGGEATFAVCTFWLINDLIFLARYDEARRLFDTILSYASDLGLLAEEIDRPRASCWAIFHRPSAISGSSTALSIWPGSGQSGRSLVPRLA